MMMMMMMMLLMMSSVRRCESLRGGSAPRW